MYKEYTKGRTRQLHKNSKEKEKWSLILRKKYFGRRYLICILYIEEKNIERRFI